jgi:fructosamine-3-kinase
LIENLVYAIAAGCGIPVTRYEQVQGGDINDSYCLFAGDTKYFLKLNNASRFPGMFEMEADGLEALRNNSGLVIPGVIRHGIQEDRQWLLLQWIEKQAPAKTSMQHFGAALANMHQQPQSCFGWHSPNYIGSLPQLNIQQINWTEFYTQCRILPLTGMLFSTGAFSKSDMNAVELFCRKTGDLFPEEPPALLHGDLWSGNYMIAGDGRVAVFDPAVYCGHREMDLGMTKLFGGFSQVFYDAYHETYPLQKDWQQRLPLTQLYPLLVHAVLFGGHYIVKTRDIITRFAGQA